MVAYSTVNNKNRRKAQSSAKMNPVWIWSPYSESGWLPKFNRFFLVERYVYDKIFRKIKSVFPEMSQIVAKCPIWHPWKIPGWDPDADNFQTLITSSSSTDKSLVKFSWRSDQLFNVKLLRDRQTDKRHVKRNRHGRGNYSTTEQYAKLPSSTLSYRIIHRVT